MNILANEIRQYLQGLLMNQTFAKDRVKNAPETGFFWDELPAIAIYTLDERPGDWITVNPPRKREMIIEIKIDVAVRFIDGWNDHLGIFCQQVANLIPVDFKGKAEIFPAGVQSFPDIDGENHIMIAQMNYEACYEWVEGALVDIGELPDLKAIYVGWDMVDHHKNDVETGPDGQIDAKDTIENIDI